MSRVPLRVGVEVKLRGDDRVWTVTKQHHSGITWYVRTREPEPAGWPGSAAPSWYCNYGRETYGVYAALILPSDVHSIQQEGTSPDAP